MLTRTKIFAVKTGQPHFRYYFAALPKFCEVTKIGLNNQLFYFRLIHIFGAITFRSQNFWHIVDCILQNLIKNNKAFTPAAYRNKKKKE